MNGWFVGGAINTGLTTVVSTIDRLTFASDTTVAVTRGSLSSTLFGSSTQANATDGWIGGGAMSNLITSSNVQRIIFNNDGLIASVRGPISLPRVGTASP